MRFRNRPCRLLAIVVAIALAATLAACSDLYYDRRETISRHGGDAMEADKTIQMVDPWPAGAANRTIETDGERMQRAVERYRTGKTAPLTTAPNPVQYQPVLAPTQQPNAPPTQ